MRYAIKLAGLAAAGALAIAGCGAGTAVTHTAAPAAGPAATRPTPTPTFEFKDVESLIAAMAVHGAPCSAVSFLDGGAVPGSINPYVQCSGASQDDTTVSMFTSHASALTYARSNITSGLGTCLPYPAAEVVGPNWVVNTVPAFAKKVVHAVGGQVISCVPAAGPSASTSPSATPAPTMTRQTDIVVFKVWGSGYPSIQYGSDSDSIDTQGGYGPLGDGNALPWSAFLTYDPGALYYAVTAQLEGSGDISDSVTEVITTYCSSSSPKTESFPLASGSASGGYAIAQAEYTGGDTGNAQQAESDAGC
jgi:hypothetical protein